MVNGLLTGNKLQARLNELGYETDNTDWDLIGSIQSDNKINTLLAELGVLVGKLEELQHDYQSAELDIEGNQE